MKSEIFTEIPNQIFMNLASNKEFVAIFILGLIIVLLIKKSK